jgi:hypothetical protein
MQVAGMLLMIVFFFSHDALFCISFAAEVLRAYGESVPSGTQRVIPINHLCCAARTSFPSHETSVHSR